MDRLIRALVEDDEDAAPHGYETLEERKLLWDRAWRSILSKIEDSQTEAKAT